MVIRHSDEKTTMARNALELQEPHVDTSKSSVELLAVGSSPCFECPAWLSLLGLDTADESELVVEGQGVYSFQAAT